MMNRRFLWKFILFLPVIFLIGVFPSWAQEKNYINGIDVNFPPFAFVDKNGIPDGFDVKALDWIAKEMGFKVEHQPIAWDGIVSSLIGKEIDLIASGMSITGERKKQVYFTIPYWKIRQVLIVRKDSKVTRKTAMAHHNKIGVQQDTMEARWIDENLIKKARKKFTLVYYDSTPMVIEDVISGRIDAAVTKDASARDAVKKASIMILGTFGMPDEQFGYAVRPEDRELLKELNTGLKRLMASPYWNELKAKYINQ